MKALRLSNLLVNRFTTIILLIPLFLFGAITVYSATYYLDDLRVSFYRFLVYHALGFGLFLALQFLPAQIWRQRVVWIVGLISTWVLLIVVFFTPSVNGARRWIDFGFFDLQPAELAKFVLILITAGILATARKGKQDLVARHVAAISPVSLTLFITSITAGLVFLQPSLSNTLILVAIPTFLLISYFVQEKLWLWLLAFSGIIVALLATFGLVISSPQSLSGVLSDYQIKRITGFVNPTADPLGANYQVIKSVRAISSAGLFGYGFLNGPQLVNSPIPEGHTDAVFALIAEQFGFFGGLICLLFYLLLFITLQYQGLQTTSPFTRNITAGCIIYLAAQVFVNIGAVTGLIPATGVPLPLISYGGSSILTTYLILGVTQSLLSKNRHVDYENYS